MHVPKRFRRERDGDVLRGHCVLNQAGLRDPRQIDAGQDERGGPDIRTAGGDLDLAVDCTAQKRLGAEMRDRCLKSYFSILNLFKPSTQPWEDAPQCSFQHSGTSGPALRILLPGGMCALSQGPFARDIDSHSCRRGRSPSARLS